MEMLGKVITLLGASPLYRTVNFNKIKFWCGYNVKSTQEITEFLKENIEGEKLAIKNYRIHITQIKDPKIIALLERIIIDEEKHIEIFNMLLHKFSQKV